MSDSSNWRKGNYIHILKYHKDKKRLKGCSIPMWYMSISSLCFKCNCVPGQWGESLISGILRIKWAPSSYNRIYPADIRHTRKSQYFGNYLYKCCPLTIYLFAPAVNRLHRVREEAVREHAAEDRQQEEENIAGQQMWCNEQRLTVGLTTGRGRWRAPPRTLAHLLAGPGSSSAPLPVDTTHHWVMKQSLSTHIRLHMLSFIFHLGIRIGPLWEETTHNLSLFPHCRI